MDNALKLFLILIINISFIKCYNNTELRYVTKDTIANYSREEGYEGCYALYDRGANDTETCTQFKLEYPYICCKVHYEVEGYKNDFRMPIANNPDSIGDVVSAFKNANNLDINCYSYMIKFFKKSIFFLFILIA